MQVAAAVSEDSLYLLFAELEKGLEEPTRRSAAALVLTNFCANSKLDYQEHVSSLLTVCSHACNLCPWIFCRSLPKLCLPGICSVQSDRHLARM